MEDSDLVEEARRGRGEAFEALVKRYEKKVFHLAYGFVQDRAAADDLAQEIFVKAYLALPKFKARSGFGTWLYRIAMNHIKDYLRKASRRKEVSLEEFRDFPFTAGDEIKAREDERTGERRRQAVLKVLETLPPKYRVILTLRDVEGLSYEEITRVLKISPGTVDSRLHRARKMLRLRMSPYLGEEGEGS